MGAQTDRRKSGTSTLGDLLYADNAKIRVSEEYWVGLVRSIAAGDQIALRTLFEMAHRILFTMIVRITSDRETAEEITLDVFYDVWCKASSYDPSNGSVVGWLMNQARCRAIDRVRFEHRKKRVNPDRNGAPTAIEAIDPHQALELNEQGRLLRGALDVLTAEERQVIETAFFAELTYAEVAARFNQPVGSVKTRIRSGLTKLRKALAAPPEAT